MLLSHDMEEFAEVFSHIVVLHFPLFQTSLLDLKEHASSLASSGLKKDSKLKSLEITLEQKKEECLKLENQLRKVREREPNIGHSVSQLSSFSMSHSFKNNYRKEILEIYADYTRLDCDRMIVKSIAIVDRS